jgi:hypothetical protein
MNRNHLLVLALMVVVSSARAAGHHPFSGYENRQITVEGKVAGWMYREPHSYVQLISVGADGQTRRWVVEWRGAAELRRSGVMPETLKPGQQVTVTGYPGRVAAESRLRLQAILRSEDGWRWMEGLK